MNWDEVSVRSVREGFMSRRDPRNRKERKAIKVRAKAMRHMMRLETAAALRLSSSKHGYTIPGRIHFP